MRTFTTTEELQDAVGEELGTTDWIEIDQDRVDLFADATDDHQWIHVDQERAAAGPFGATIAHGYLTLSLIPWLSSQIFSVDTPGARLNYGLNKVRFPTPVKVGARIRGRASIVALTDVPAGKQLTVAYTIEVDGEAKPACVAETVVLLLA
ncbi:MaoC family dehydratase [Nocardioides dilutus]